MKTSFNPFRDGELDAAVPTTASQKEIFSSCLADPQAALAFNEGIELEFSGPLQRVALERALIELAKRHESLRANFDRRGMFACIAGSPRLDFDVVTDADQYSVEEQRAALVRHVFDLQQDVLWRVVLVQQSDDQHTVFLLFHHIVVDGWSMAVLLEELEALYNASLNEVEAQLEPPKSFVDYALHESRGHGNADASHWLEKFATLPAPLDLPLDRGRPEFRTFGARRLDVLFSRDLIDPFTRAGGRQGATLVASFLSALFLQLRQLTGQDDLILGMAVAGQLDGDFQSLVGHCVKMLPVRQQVPANASFAELVPSVKEAVMDAYEHQSFTFAELVRQLNVPRDAARIPLIPVVFNIDQEFAGIELDGLTCRLRTLPRVAENFEVFFNFLPGPDGVLLEATFNTDLFDEATVRGWIDGLKRSLILISEQPELPLDQWAPPESANSTVGPDVAVGSALPLDLHEVLVSSTGSVVYEGSELSGAELDLRARRIGSA
ncbi:MAG: condensation domain-containing protein, partial [Pseudomonadota bacterium]